jgi:D-glycero-beta-D-manno-heptose-7-phosphate kinase
MTRDFLSALLPKFRTKKVLVVGDIMLDRFLWGNVTRISPEAPVPVVHVTKETAYAGGAANVARNLAKFAGKVGILGLCGPGALTEQLRGLLVEDAIDTSGMIEDPGHETIVKTRIVARSQQIARIDRECLKPLSCEALAKAEAWLDEHLSEYDAVIIEDYAKGFLTQALVDAVVRRSAGKLVTVDPNPSNPLQWNSVDTIKPNRKEAFAAAGMPDPNEVSEAALLAVLPQLAERLFSQWKTERLLITLGEHGMALLEQGKPVYHTPTKAREVFDVSGAGDTAIALFTLALAAGASGAEAAEVSNLASGIVVGKIGTATVSPEELLG